MSTTITCDVRFGPDPANDANRFDLRIGETTYLGAALQGNGGLQRGSVGRFAAWWGRRQSEGGDQLVWTRDTATAWDHVRVPSQSVEVLRVWPRRDGR
mgnify:FL=1